MIPILYESNETAFTSQGIGALAESTSASVSRVLNGKDELVLVYPCTGVRYADLQNDRIIFAQPEYKKSAQPYQIYKITKPLNGLVTVYARHVGTQRAKYIPVAPFQAGSVIQVFNDLPTYLKESNPFTFWTNKDTVANFKLTIPASLGSVLGGMEGSILDVYGGEYEFDGYTIKLWSRRGSDSGVELRYGKNITNIEHNEDFDGIVTGVVPYWEGMDNETVYLPEIVVEGAYADQYSFRRSIIKDFSEAFEDKPTEAQLRAAAQNYIAQTGISLPKVDLSVNFEHLAQYTEYEGIALLEQLNLGDSVSIYYEPLGVSATARIVKTNYDCLTEKYISVQIGSVKNDLAQIMSAQANTAQELKNAISKTLPSAIEEAVEHVTDLITGAEGGYVVLDRDANGKPYQILIMDTDSKNTATNVIRLNQNGIGFSTSGYSGPYTTAWTIDSNFVADFITTGNFNASLAKIGTLQDAAGKNSWNMQTGAFTLTDGSMDVLSTKTFYASDYSASDITAIQNIITGDAPATEADIAKYDLNLDGIINLIDMMTVRDLVNGTISEYTASTGIKINPQNSTELVQVYSGSKKSVITPGSIRSSVLYGGNSYLSNNKLVLYNGTALAADYGSSEAEAITLLGHNGSGTLTHKASWNPKTGLTFRDSSDVVTANYPSDGLYFMSWTTNNGMTSSEICNLLQTNNANIPTRKTVIVRISGPSGSYMTLIVQNASVNYGAAWPVGYYSKYRFELAAGTWSVQDYYDAVSTASSWYVGRVRAGFRIPATFTDTGSYHAALDMKSRTGDWSIGVLNNDLYFVFTTDTNYSGSNNTTYKYKLPYVSSEGTFTLAPTHISGSGTLSAITTYKYSGVSFTIPAGKYFSMTAHAYYSNVSPTGVVIATSSTNLGSGALQMEGGADYTGTRARCTLSGYLSSATTYYVWAKASASGNLGIGLDGFYIG